MLGMVYLHGQRIYVRLECVVWVVQSWQFKGHAIDLPKEHQNINPLAIVWEFLWGTLIEVR
jgi:hypothetical protein